MAITGDNQWEWRSFKVGDPDNTGYAVISWDPGTLPVRRNPKPKPGRHGTIRPRSGLLNGREPRLVLEIEATSRASLRSRIDALVAATVPDEDGDDTLKFQILSETRRMYVEPSPARWLWTSESDLGLLVANVVVDFYAQDPAIYVDATSATAFS